MTRSEQLAIARALQHETLDPPALLEAAQAEIETWRLSDKARRAARAAARCFLTDALISRDDPRTVQAWWTGLERHLLQAHHAEPGRRQASAVRALVVGRIVQPSWALLTTVQVDLWVRVLPVDDPLVAARQQLREALERLTWTTAKGRRAGVTAGMRLLLSRGYERVDQLRDADLAGLPLRAPGLDMLDAALCELGVLQRSALRGSARRSTAEPKTVEQLVTAGVAEPFQAVTIAYLEAYRQRVSAKYVATPCKIRSLAYFWEYLTTVHPQVRECCDVLPHYARGFVPWALVKARTIQRSIDRKGSEDRTTTTTGSSTSAPTSPTCATGPPNPARPWPATHPPRSR